MDETKTPQDHGDTQKSEPTRIPNPRGPAHPPEQPLLNRTLQRLPVARRPQQFTLCQACTNAVWLATDPPGESLKAFCQVLFQVVWDDREQVPTTHCDAHELPGEPTE